MSREWQQTKMKELLLPEAVYYQCLWAVRDLTRMEKRLTEIYQRFGKDNPFELRDENNIKYGKLTEKIAVERVVLEERIRAIRKALNQVPDGYRSYILSNIILKNSGKSFGNNMWRLWKQKFLYEVANNLELV